jgi:threonine dehydratase
MMAKLSSEQLERGVICSSAGNHAQGVALSAQRLGCDAIIVMPVTTPEIKVFVLHYLKTQFIFLQRPVFVFHYLKNAIYFT